MRAAWGSLDILVNNAGAAASHKFVDHPDALWHQMIAVNLTGVYYVTKACVPSLIEQRWGRVINIASIAARVGAQVKTMGERVARSLRAAVDGGSSSSACV